MSVFSFLPSALDPPTVRNLFSSKTVSSYGYTYCVSSYGRIQARFNFAFWAAQIPCQYCVYANTVALKKMGATPAEIKEAVAMAGYIRLMSTILNGSGYDFEKFTQEYDQLVAGS